MRMMGGGACAKTEERLWFSHSSMSSVLDAHQALGIEK